MKIFAVGMNYPNSESNMMPASILPSREDGGENINYQEHNKELHGTLYNREAPVIFTKADSALVTHGKPFFVPSFTEQCEYETEVVVRICRLGRSIAQRWAHRYYDQVTVGIDFTARDLQRKLRSEGLPWELCKGFDGSAVIGEMVPKDTLPDVQNLHFRLEKNGETVQAGHTADMLFKVDEIVSYISQFFTLKMGDLIYTGTPAGVGPVHEGDHLVGYLEDRKVLDFDVK